MKITLVLKKPRNPLVVPARFRLAGRHHRSGARQRQESGRALRCELEGIGKHGP